MEAENMQPAMAADEPEQAKKAEKSDCMEAQQHVKELADATGVPDGPDVVRPKEKMPDS